MKNKLVLSISISVLLVGCTTTEPKKITEKAVETSKVNDFPTRDRVEYVLNCVAKHGGLNYINQYACGCKIDKIAEKMTFEEYESAKTFSYLKKTPGENGAAFRDPKHAKDLRALLKEADTHAESQCFVK